MRPWRGRSATEAESESESENAQREKAVDPVAEVADEGVEPESGPADSSERPQPADPQVEPTAGRGSGDGGDSGEPVDANASAPGAPPPAPDPLEECLIFLARHLDVPVSASAIRASHVGQGRRLDPDAFVELARTHGMEAARGRRDPASIPSTLLPCVALLAGGRAVVLLQHLGEGQVAYFDPALGRESVRGSLASLQDESLGEIIPVRPRHRATAGTEAPLVQSGHWFWSALSSNRWTYARSSWRRR